MSKNHEIIAVQNLLDEISGSNLYPQLLIQLQKDIHRAGIDYSLNLKLNSSDLITDLQSLLLDKLQNTFNEYLNLLYAVDVSEAKMKNFASENIKDIANFATYLILKREWAKVWLRHNSMNS